MLTFSIDDKTVMAHQGDTILDVARANGIFIPALCYHKAVSAYGACRLCLVEVRKGDRKRVVASCSYPAENGISVDTRASAAVQARNIAIELLMARCPDNPVVFEIAEKMGVHSSRFEKRDHDCILCGLCIRVCKEVIGADCIAFSGRGSDRQVVTPYGKPTQHCIGCGACVSVCPTGSIRLEDAESAVVLPDWQTVVPQAKCRECGRHFAPHRQIEYVQARLREGSELLDICPECKRRRFSQLAMTIHESTT